MLPFRFYLITDRLSAGERALSLLPELAQAGLCALQVREKDLSPAWLFHHCQDIQQALNQAPDHPVSLYLNDRADLALSLGFAGVHLREESLPLASHHTTLREALRFGVSTHNLEGVKAAEAAGAQFATFGPVFPTASKTAYGDPVGLKALEEAASRTRLPLLALGGVNPDNAGACLSAGATGVAAISAIWEADDPLAELEAFARALGGL